MVDFNIAVVDVSGSEYVDEVNFNLLVVTVNPELLTDVLHETLDGINLFLSDRDLSLADLINVDLDAANNADVDSLDDIIDQNVSIDTDVDHDFNVDTDSVSA